MDNTIWNNQKLFHNEHKNLLKWIFEYERSVHIMKFEYFGYFYDYLLILIFEKLWKKNMSGWDLE